MTCNNVFFPLNIDENQNVCNKKTFFIDNEKYKKQIMWFIAGIVVVLVVVGAGVDVVMVVLVRIFSFHLVVFEYPHRYIPWFWMLARNCT